MRKFVLFTGALFAVISASAQWAPDARLTNDPSASRTTLNTAWCIGASGDTVHIIWYDDRDGNQEIYYKRSTNGGLDWEQDVRLTFDTSISSYPSIAIWGNDVFATWHDNRDGDYEIYFKRSTNGGSTWGEDTRLTIATGFSFRPSIAISGSFVCVVWHDFRDGNWEIYYKCSANGGVNWSADVRLTNDLAYSFSASVSISDSIVHVAFHDTRDGNYEIYYKRSYDRGTNWDQDTCLTNILNIYEAKYPSISASGSLVNVVWHDTRDWVTEIYYKHSADGGTTWGEDIRLTNHIAGDSRYPSIALSGSAVHVVWCDTRDCDLDIYYKLSGDEGMTWGADIRLTDAGGDSQYPSITVSGSVVHVIWSDMRDGNEEIYYKRNPVGAVVTGISVTPLLQNVPAAAGTTAFTVTSNTYWSASSDAAWCTVSASGTGNGSIIAQYSENTSSQPRTASIHVTGEGVPDLTVTLTQAKSTLGVEKNPDISCRIYPNPSDGLFSITPPFGDKSAIEVFVLDLNGKNILNMLCKGQKEYSINLSSALQGIYPVIIKINNITLVRKLSVIK